MSGGENSDGEKSSGKNWAAVITATTRQIPFFSIYQIFLPGPLYPSAGGCALSGEKSGGKNPDSGNRLPQLELLGRSSSCFSFMYCHHLSG